VKLERDAFGLDLSSQHSAERIAGFCRHLNAKLGQRLEALFLESFLEPTFTVATLLGQPCQPGQSFESSIVREHDFLAKDQVKKIVGASLELAMDQVLAEEVGLEWRNKLLFAGITIVKN
jgi:hypothetical protein